MLTFRVGNVGNKPWWAAWSHKPGTGGVRILSPGTWKRNDADCVDKFEPGKPIWLPCLKRRHALHQCDGVFCLPQRVLMKRTLTKKQWTKHGAAMRRRRTVAKYLGGQLGLRVSAKQSNKTLCKLIDEAEPEFRRLHQGKSNARIIPLFYDWILSQRGHSVYIIGNREHGLCKIGVSKDPEQRCRTIQTGFPYPLEVLAVFPGKSFEYEKRLHKRAAPYQLQGEWFRIEGRLKDFLNSENATGGS